MQVLWFEDQDMIMKLETNTTREFQGCIPQIGY